ncbi:MAG: DUF4097 family beta strand repeat-containing protein [Pseudomonadota bacterium]
MNKVKLILLVGAGLAMIAMPVKADVDVDRTVDASPTGEVEIETISGRIEVEGWSRNEVQVTGTIGDDVEELIVERDGDEVTIKTEVDESWWGSSDSDADLLIRVPAGSSVEVSTVSSNIDVEGVNGEIEADAVSGNVTIDGADGDISGNTVSGDVRITGNTSVIDVEGTSVSGNVIIKDVAGSAYGESVSGRIEVSGDTFSEVDLETVNGRIEFRGELSDGAEFDAESVNGRIELALTGDVSASFDIETFNGSIRNCFGPKPERTSKYAPGSELRFTHGGGAADVELETLNGSIVICND